jgi:hypothetical protein
MCKVPSIVNLHTRKDFWNQCVNDASKKIAKAKQRVKQLERAREQFRKNASEGVDIPGSMQSRGRESSQQHSV